MPLPTETTWTASALLLAGRPSEEASAAVPRSGRGLQARAHAACPARGGGGALEEPDEARDQGLPGVAEHRQVGPRVEEEGPNHLNRGPDVTQSDHSTEEGRD